MTIKGTECTLAIMAIIHTKNLSLCLTINSKPHATKHPFPNSKRSRTRNNPSQSPSTPSIPHPHYPLITYTPSPAVPALAPAPALPEEADPHAQAAVVPPAQPTYFRRLDVETAHLVDY